MPESYRVHPKVHEIVKLLPHNPPMKGDVVLVEGKRARVIKNPKLDWEGRKWTLKGDLVVRFDA